VRVSLSVELLPEFREYERSSTTVANAYLAPALSAYLAEIEPAPLVMQSSGGVVDVETAQADGASIETVESLASGSELHPLQRAVHEHFGLQCGFCTPGILVTAKFFLEQNPAPTEEEIRAELAGNLCRCTGYAPIVDSILAAADALRG
jgi:xanthine dehydrogenase iron-sulfur cluster and FAD-binding subunit A